MRLTELRITITQYNEQRKRAKHITDKDQWIVTLNQKKPMQNKRIK